MNLHDWIDELSDVLDVAARKAGLDRDLWYRQVRGDGELAVLPTDADAASRAPVRAPVSRPLMNLCERPTFSPSSACVQPFSSRRRRIRSGLVRR